MTEHISQRGAVLCVRRLPEAAQAARRVGECWLGICGPDDYVRRERVQGIGYVAARLHRNGPEFSGDERGDNGLTNHGPMAVEVICRRGLEIDVHRWLDRYIRRLTELPATAEPITDATWRQALGGGHRRIGDWTAYFTHQLAERPWR